MLCAFGHPVATFWGLLAQSWQFTTSIAMHAAYVAICWVDMLRSFGRGLTSMPMCLLATYWAEMEHSILFMRIVNRYLERQQFFSARKRFSLKERFVYVTITSDLGKEKFVLASESNLSCYVLSFSNLMKWIIKMEPTSRWILYMIFGKHVLCRDTEWRWMFVSNRYKVNFVVQRRYATCQVQIEKETCFAEFFN